MINHSSELKSGCTCIMRVYDL